jgi:nucleoside-diphosphate-sugar epimerase
MAVVVITGGAGSIGQKLKRHLAALGGHELRLLDVAQGGDPDVRVADLAVWDDAWVRAFEGADAVVHLAGDPRPEASWASIQRLNLDLCLNVFEAAAGRARRLIFASSNWVVNGYRGGSEPLTPDMEPWPVNAYGMSKLVGERVGRLYAERRGLSVVCFRIGWCQHTEGNRPGPHMGYGTWGQEMWLSDRDIAQAVEQAVMAPDTLRFAVLNLTSQNECMRWDLGPTRDAIGYVPLDRSTPVITEETRKVDAAHREGRQLAAAIEGWLARRKW